MQTRLNMNYREDPAYVGCTSTTNSQQEQNISNQTYNQKLYPSASTNFDLHRRQFGQELQNYGSIITPHSNYSTNIQSQKNVASGYNNQNIIKKFGAQNEIDTIKYNEKLNRGISLQQQQSQQTQQQQYQSNKAYYTKQTPLFFDSMSSISQVGSQQERQVKDGNKRKEYQQQYDTYLATQKPINDGFTPKSDINGETGFQNIIKSHRQIPEQDNSNISTNNSSNENYELHQLDHAKTRSQKEIEREYLRIQYEDMATPTRVAQYSREIFQFLKMKEKVIMINKNYIEEQPDISENMRWILVDWLVEVHFKFKLLQETLFIAIYIIDKYLSLAQIKRNKLQLVGITALFIAAKYEEIYPPDLQKFSDITDKACSKRDILNIEGDIICALNFQITVPSSYRFTEWYTRLSEFSDKDSCLAFHFVEIALLDTRFLKYSPSNIAASAVYMVNKLNKSENCWPELLEKDSNYTEQKLRPCAKDLIFIHQKLQTSQQKAILTKYSCKQFHKVGLMVLNKREEQPNSLINSNSTNNTNKQKPFDQYSRQNTYNYNSNKD